MVRGLAPLALLVLPATASALDCAGRDPVVCDAVNGIVDAANAELGFTLLSQSATAARYRPTALYAKLLAAKNRAVAGGCAIDGFSGGVYDSAASSETWRGTLERAGAASVYDTLGTCSLVGNVWTGMATGDDELALGDEYGTFNDVGQVAGNAGDDGLFAGVWIRRQGNRGVYGALVGTCPPGVDSAEVMDPWFDGVLSTPEPDPEVPACTSSPCVGQLLDSSGAESRGVWADASGVYWANRANGSIRRADLDGGNVTVFAAGVPALGLLFGDDTYVYAPEYAGSAVVHRIRKSDGARDTLVTIPGSPPLHGIDFIDGAFYLTVATAGASNSGAIWRFAPGDASATLVQGGLRDRLFGLTHDPATNTVYLASNGSSAGSGTGIVETTASPPTSPLSLVTTTTGLSYPIQSQVHGSYLYVANANENTVVRIPLAGGAPEIVAECEAGTAQTYGLSVYQGVLYYTCLLDNELRAVGL